MSEQNSQQQAKAEDILARTLYGEARGEAPKGIMAVGAVVMNRVRFAQERGRYWWGNTVVEVCLRPWQFSCWNKNDPNLKEIQSVTLKNRRFRLCVDIAKQAMAAQVQDPTAGATHYHRIGLTPPWTRNATQTAEIGQHLFYKDIA